MTNSEIPLKTALGFTTGTSDKVYIVKLIRATNNSDTDATLWTVEAEYGRRYGTRYTNHWLTDGKAISYTEAREVYEKVIRTKVNKGYIIESRN